MGFVNFGKGSEALVNSILEGNVESINNNNITVLRSSAFQSCTKLTSVILEKCQQVGGSALSNCTSLVYVYMPLLKTAELNCFNGCKSLQEIYLPQLQSLKTQAFVHCTSLNKVYCNALDIAGNAFMNCQSLATLILANNNIATLSNVNAFSSTLIASGTGYIYVPKALIEDYKTATNWTTYADQFRAIEDYPTICEVSE